MKNDDSTLQNEYIHAILPQQLENLASFWKEEGKAGDGLRVHPCAYPVKGFRHFDELYLRLERDLTPSDAPLYLVVYVPAEWNPSYAVKNYMMKGTLDEILHYLQSPEGCQEIGKSAISLDADRNHEDPRD